MAIVQTKKQSDLEKRLKLLRQQVYGKEKVESITRPANYQQHAAPSSQPTTDLTYLYQDLFKILVFSSFAIGAQVILFFLSKNHILNLNFF